MQCAWMPEGYEHPKAEECILVHEQEHADDVNCDRAPEDGIGMSSYNDDVYYQREECVAYTRMLICLTKAMSSCSSPEECELLGRYWAITLCRGLTVCRHWWSFPPIGDLDDDANIPSPQEECPIGRFFPVPSP